MQVSTVIHVEVVEGTDFMIQKTLPLELIPIPGDEIVVSILHDPVVVLDRKIDYTRSAPHVDLWACTQKALESKRKTIEQF